MAGRLAAVIAYLRVHWMNIVREGAINFIGPFLIYTWLKPSLGDVHALMASSAPPIAWTLIEFARHRRVDFISVFVLAGIALSLIAFFGGGSAKFLQLRERLVGGIIALVFLGSAAIGKPIIYQLARAGMRRSNSAELAGFEARRDDPRFRRVMNIMTLVWGFGLLADTVAGVVMVMTMSIREYMIAGRILGYVTMGALALWTFWYARRERRRGEAIRAAEEAAKAAAEEPPVE
ncbi:MAG: VC0807 family protein [Caulobacteraceae bacterium]